MHRTVGLDWAQDALRVATLQSGFRGFAIQDVRSVAVTADGLKAAVDALGLTPAYCHAVASFYDMFHLAPVGEHLVEVCTNLSCALSGAQRVVEAFEAELGVRAGETTADGAVTFRTVECLGGCGYATVVAIDHRYREHVNADDVPSIVETIHAR